MFERSGVRERMVEPRGVGNVDRGVDELGGLSLNGTRNNLVPRDLGSLGGTGQRALVSGI